jgi:hypothetical protein
MILLNNIYIKYFFYLTKKIHLLWSVYNIFLLKWNIKWNFKNYTTLYKPVIWILHFSAELESFVISYYFFSLINKNINLTNYSKNFNIFFKSNFFQFNINFFIQNILKYIKIIIKLLTFNIKWILISFLISFIYFFFSLFYLQLEFTKQLAVWFVILIVFYLLMSTFNNFLNKYKYGKFTSAIQRFWKRTGMTFWLLEGFLFLIFFYYFLNSSQEPLYMYDYANLNQELLIQLKVSYKNMILLSLAIYFSFILILNNNYLNYYQNIILLSLISLIVFFMLYVETYQFVYIVSLFSDKNWNFDESSQIWILEFEQNNLRVKQQYFTLCLIAKYWHFIFIFISWFFFVIKCFEINKINYTLMGYNVQNLLILYVLNLFCLIQWSKWIFKKFLELTYYWFHIQYDEKFFVLIIQEIITILTSFVSFNDNNFININWQNISNILYYSNELNLWKYINWLMSKNS